MIDIGEICAIGSAANLTSRQFDVWWLVEVEGMTQTAAARVLEISSGRVRQLKVALGWRKDKARRRMVARLTHLLRQKQNEGEVMAETNWIGEARNAESAADAFDVACRIVRDIIAGASPEATMALFRAHQQLLAAKELQQMQTEIQGAAEIILDSAAQTEKLKQEVAAEIARVKALGEGG